MNPAKMSAWMILALVSVFLLMAALPGQAETHRPVRAPAIVCRVD